jgi:hypothetical protein
MEEKLTMSIREFDRLHIIQNVLAKRLTWRQAAQQMKLSVRQVARLCCRVRRHGKKGLIHGLSGQPSNHRLPVGILSRAVALVKRHYPDFGPTFAQEKLAEVHKITVSVSSLRNALIDDTHWKPSKQRPFYRAWRERRPCVGELVQLDGSDHDWFEGRGARCVLLPYVDDATSRVLHGQFISVEDTLNLMAATKIYLQTCGRPLAFYVDKDSIYKINRQATIDEELRDIPPLTQFTRAMGELGIEVITANSPQAKGRVERGHGTHQDRLVKELRLAGISSMEKANPFLRDVYFPKHNARFAVAPANATNVHRPLLKVHRLHEILSLRSPRVLAHDFTLRYQHRCFQLLADQPCRVRPGADIEVETRLDGSTHLRFKDRYLNFKPLPDSARGSPVRKSSVSVHKPRPGTLEYTAKNVYVGAWAIKKGDISTCPAIKSSL